MLDYIVGFMVALHRNCHPVTENLYAYFENGILHKLSVKVSVLLSMSM